MLAGGVKPGDVVLTVANAGAYTTLAAKALGAEIVFCDVDESNLQLSLDTFQATLEVCASKNIQPTALVVTHLFGLLNPDILDIVAVARAQGILVIEDCAQAVGAKSGDSKAGSFGDIGAFSFYPTKNMGAFGDGGAVVSHDVTFIEKVRALREYGWKEKYNISIAGGRNSRLDEIQAALLNLKLRQVDETNSLRRSIYAKYLESLNESFVSFAPVGEEYVAHLAVFATRDASRSGVVKAFAERGASTTVHYPVLDVDQKLDLRHRNLIPLPVSRKYVDSIFTVPLFPTMADFEISCVSNALSKEI